MSYIVDSRRLAKHRHRKRVNAVALTLSRFPLNPALMLLVGGVARLCLRMVGL